MAVRFFVKCFLKIGNLLVGASGVILLALGIVLIFKEYFIGVYEILDYSTGDFAIGVGIFVVGLSIYGICSICIGKKIFVLIYGGVLICFFIIELALAISAKNIAVDSNRELNKTVIKGLRKRYDEYIQNPKKAELVTMITSIHEIYECCGVFNATETFGTKDKIPISCYKVPKNAKDIPKNAKPFTKGCAKRVYFVYIMFVAFLSLTTFFIAGFDVIVIILAFVFALLFSEPAPE